MEHLESGDLRRMIDEPEAFDAQTRLHAQNCAECRERAAEVAKDAQEAERALAGSFDADASRAFARVSEAVEAPAPRSPWTSPLIAASLAAVFVLALVFTPLGTYARSFLTVFEPQAFQPIEVSRADLQNLHLLPQANDVGTQRVVRKPQRTYYDSIAAAQKHASFTLLRPAALPASLRSVHSYSIMSPGEMTFTFSATKARAFEKRSGKALPPMPQGLDGTTVRLQTAQVFGAHYEAASSNRHASGNNATPFVEIVQAGIPNVTSTGASLDTLERYLLSMPNVSPNLASQIRALGDIANTVPVPVIIDKQSARPVTIDGVRGLAVGDNTGLGAGVMWQKNGTIYVVAGPLSMDEVLTVAHGLR